MSLARRLRQELARGLRKRLDHRDERRFLPQWFLLAGLCPPERLFAPDPGRLAPVYPPRDRFWADPFAWSVGGRRFVFFEEYPYAARVGRISVLELGPNLEPKGPAEPVIEETRHLSYPFLFAHQDQLYMVPESATSRRIDLYRCTRFPLQWVRECTLIDGIQAADATLVEHSGRWWLFCAARVDKAHINESLFAFHADSPLSTHWVPHARNPLVRDYSGGRPGGRIFQDSEGRLIRPAQDSVPRYGYGLRLKVIEKLTTERFVERAIWSATGEASGGWRAMHHLDWHDGLMVMDAQRLIPRPSPA